MYFQVFISLLVDVENKDFRPKSRNAFVANVTGQIIGKSTGTTIGPYPPKGEYIKQYSIPGQMLDVASHPIPMTGSVVKGRDSLMFRPAFRYMHIYL